MRHVRFVLLCVAVWVMALVVVRRYMCIGWVLPVQVASHSMVPALFGPHLQTECEGCGSSIRLPVENSGTAHCLHCDHATLDTQALQKKNGTRVLIDRREIRKHGIQRFHVVACASHRPRHKYERQESRHALMTKRVLGMPGEEVAIVDGDVLVDNVILRKTARQFEDSAILVHADRFRSSQAPPRWDVARHASTVDSIPTSWNATTIDDAVGYEWRRASTESKAPANTTEWLLYQHRSSAGVVTASHSQRWIFDDYQFNAGCSRPLHRVHDLALSADVRWTGDGTIKIRCPANAAQCELHLQVDGGRLHSVELFINKDSPSAVQLDLTTDEFVAPQGAVRVLFGYWDRQVVCRLNEIEVLSYPLEGELSERETQFGWSSEGLAHLAITDLSVWRDLFYYVPKESALFQNDTTANGAASKCILGRLKASEVLLLGDNVPRSIDARYGPEFGIVEVGDVLGHVVPVN